MKLILKDIHKEYERGGKNFTVLEKINLEISQGDFINIIGRSGSGKSTLLNIAAGMLRPTSGLVELDGENLFLKNDSALSLIRNKKIGFIPQGMSALPNLNVIENIILPSYIYPSREKNFAEEVAARAKDLLMRLKISELEGAYPSELSGGELRRVIIARALINRPEIIIADEPTSDLDVKTSAGIMEFFTTLNAEGMTILLVSHDLDSLKYGRRVLTMQEGNLIEGNKL